MCEDLKKWMWSDLRESEENEVVWIDYVKVNFCDQSLLKCVTMMIVRFFFSKCVKCKFINFKNI